MKLCVVVSSSEHLKTAGVRIRYQRLQKKLKELGCELTLKTIDSLTADKLNDDIYLICKVYDVRAAVLMRACKQRKRLVGVDFFDNYFSQDQDPRFERLREWVATLSEYADFALCATPRMQALLADKLLVGTPCHVVNDPYDRFDREQLVNSLETRVTRAKESKTLNICWFGIGSNSHFPIGLNDLYAFRDYLVPFRTSGYKTRITVMSNLRAQKADSFIMLSELGLDCELREWNEAAEKELVSQSDVSFLPVNGQSFSTVKSLNRAISALCGGTQVLSVGFPLYQSLGNFIYRDASTLIKDLDKGQLAVRSETLDQLERYLNDLSNPEIEAQKLIEFLQALPITRTATAKRSLFVVHGRQTTSNNNKYARKHAALSVATPFSPESLNYDVTIAFKSTLSGRPEIRLTEAAASRLLSKFRRKVEPQVFTVNNQRVQALPLSAVDKNELQILSQVNNSDKYTALTWYEPTIAIVFDLITRLYGKVDIHLSELQAPLRKPATSSLSSEHSGGMASDHYHA